MAHSPPTENTDSIIIIINEDYTNDLSMDCFSHPNNGDAFQLPPTVKDQEYGLEELFGDGGTEETAHCPNAQAGPQFENDNDINWILDDGQELALAIGLEHLSIHDAALGALITEHSVYPLFDAQEMTTFQRVTRQLLESISVPERKATIYQALEHICQPDIVRPHSVRRASDEQLMKIGVASRSEAMTFLDLGNKFAEAGGVDMNTLLSDDLINSLSDGEIFCRLQEVRGLGAYNAFTIMLWGLQKMLNYWPIERELTLKYDEFNQQLQRWPGSDEAVATFESWEPFKGLAAWLIWTYS